MCASDSSISVIGVDDVIVAVLVVVVVVVVIAIVMWNVFMKQTRAISIQFDSNSNSKEKCSVLSLK